MTILSSANALLPPLYARWIDQLLLDGIPSETRATCMDCVMCNIPIKTPQDVVFNSKTKCCTYNPDIPNFLAGAILLDTQAGEQRGRSLFANRLNRPAILRPQGVSPSLAEAASYSLWNPGFGKEEAARCPFYLEDAGGLCGIWTHRNARCSTWFCKHENGQTGRDFWRALKELLASVEQQLSLWCIHKLEAGTLDFRELFSMGQSPSAEVFQRRQDFFYRTGLPEDHITAEERSRLRAVMWGEWLGREQEFYGECSTIVANLSWPEVLVSGGELLEQYTHNLSHWYSALVRREVPEVLHPGKLRTAPLGSENVRVWGYSNYDPVDLPAGILAILHHFDGRPTSVVVSQIVQEYKLQLTHEMLLTLCDFGILTEP